jgi:hypothetical protein
MSGEPRCPSCGALVTPEAEWCGQCFARLPTGTTAEASPAVPGRTVERGEPTWPCPVCDHANPIALTACAACGTPFARLFEEPGRRSETEPRTALKWSLLLPGLGHWKCGRPFDGVARVVVFAWTVVTIAIIVGSRPGSGGLGAATSLFGLFLLAAVALYVVSAIDAYRLASGDRELVPSRILLWASAGLMLLAMVLGALVAFPAVRGG